MSIDVDMQTDINIAILYNNISTCHIFVQVLEPIDDIKVQVQINTVTMRQIRDMLTKESTESTNINEKIESILKVIEDLRQDIKNSATQEDSFSHRRKPSKRAPAHGTTTDVPLITTTDSDHDNPKSFMVKFMESPTN